jgi:small-conductance mechanosensitive channel
MSPNDQIKEEISNDENVQLALEQAAPRSAAAKPPVEARHKFRLAGYLFLFVVFGVFYRLLALDFFGFVERFVPLLQKLSLGAMAIIAQLGLGKVVRVYLIDRMANRAARYNLHRVLNLVIGTATVLIAVSVVFADWYTAVLSLGLISLVIGFALQTLIASFFGWIYLLIKVPYKVGDRIRIEDATGDVIDVGYLDTTLWEFGGQHLSTDHPSGRIIRFPNSKVLNSAVYNYSWSLFPYIWNDIKFQIAYQSDLDFVAKTMREAAEEEVGKEMTERIKVFRNLLAQTPVDQLEVREEPAVVFRIADNTWVEAICRYLVEPRHAGPVKTRLVKTMLERLNAEPGKVMFPKGDAR